MEMIDRVARLVRQRKSNAYIAKQLGISKESTAAYKAHITRRSSIKHASRKLQRYMTSPYIVIPSERVMERLKPEQVPLLLGILDTLLKNPGGLEQKMSNNGSDIEEDRIRNIIVVCKKAGLSNDEVYEDVRLLEMAVPVETIRAYLAHWTRGTYKR